MTLQQNKQFNTYKEGLDLEILRRYCMEHGEKRTFLLLGYPRMATLHKCRHLILI